MGGGGLQPDPVLSAFTLPSLVLTPQGYGFYTHTHTHTGIKISVTFPCDSDAVNPAFLEEREKKKGSQEKERWCARASG